jgi:hypothetical protein
LRARAENTCLTQYSELTNYHMKKDAP